MMMSTNSEKRQSKPAKSGHNKKNASFVPDARFDRVLEDPKFVRIPRRERKLVVDDRFAGMFEDPAFKLTYAVDKRGRPMAKTTNDDLRRFYELSSEEEAEEKSEGADLGATISPKKKRKRKEKSKKKKENSATGKLISDIDSAVKSAPVLSKKRRTQRAESSLGDAEEQQSEQSDSSELDWGVEDEGEKLEEEEEEIKVDLARGEGVLDSSSDEDESAEWRLPGEGPEMPWGELDKDAPKIQPDNVTRRLAVCNQDWDRVKENSSTSTVYVKQAKDLLIAISSFVPIGALVKRVSIYLSQFGAERLEDEKMHGPTELRGTELDISSSDEEDTTEDKERKRAVMDKLRLYQLNRLKYYYAVVECDSAATANAIYAVCDGIAYEATGCRIDLRFVPDAMEFDEAALKDSADDIGDVTDYKPAAFENTALQQSKVQLTWDETDFHRQQLLKRAFDPEKLDSLDLKDCLATSSSEDEDVISENSSISSSAIEEDDSSEKELPAAHKIPVKTGKNKPKSKTKPELANGKPNKYRALLEEVEREEKETGGIFRGRAQREPDDLADTIANEDSDLEMEISWEPGLEETKEKPDQEFDKKKQKKAVDGLTPFEHYLERRKEKRRERKEAALRERKAARLTDAPDDVIGSRDAPFSDDEVDIDMNDPYFQNEYKKLHGGDAKPSVSSKSAKSKLRRHDVEGDGLPAGEDPEERLREMARLQMLVDDDFGADVGRHHFSLKKLVEAEKPKTKRALKKEERRQKRLAADGKLPLPPLLSNAAAPIDNFELDVADERFKAVFDSHLYNIDPSDPAFKKTKGMKQLIDERLKRSANFREDSSKRGKGARHQEKPPAGESVPVEDIQLHSKESPSVDAPQVADEVVSVDDLKRLANKLKQKVDLMQPKSNK